MDTNTILRTDSYKASHYEQYPPKTTGLYSYIEARPNKNFQKLTFFGLQMFLKKLQMATVRLDEVEEARAFFEAHMGYFPHDGWIHIARDLRGRLPIRIRALPEGTIVPVGVPLVTVESTDEKVPWIATWVETQLLRGVWYPTTVATLSWHIKKDIRYFLDLTSDDPAGQLPFKLHDFGARGASSGESAEIGGAAHLVNFMGSDTVEGIVAANTYYHHKMAAFSIPAAEHSTITSWGEENEVEAYRNMLTKFGKPNALLAVVSDSYDIYNAAENLWGGALRDEVIASGATVVIRPDSGKPVEVVSRVMRILDTRFGHTVNSKGFKVLNNVRVIQGDGVNRQSIREILVALYDLGYSADNIAFGMGGALLQGVTRDTLNFAMKVSAAKINGKWIDVFKHPKGDTTKLSKRGRVDTDTHMQAQVEGDAPSAMRTVWENGRLLVDDTLEQIRGRANE